MKQEEFLRELKAHLDRYKVANVDDIVNDYKEHFSHGIEKGSTESEIAERLGNPATIARGYETENLIKQVNTPEEFDWAMAWTVLGRLIVVAPFNFFVLLIPGVIVGSLVFAGWSVAVALLGTGLGLLAGAVGSLVGLSFWVAIALSSASVCVLGLGAMAAMIMYLVSKYVLLAVISYLQWNLKFILQK